MKIGINLAKVYMQSNKNAFTLAEVLITLGIIGVVAALTMPSLIANYQKKVWVAQLKETYSILSQGFQKMLVDDGVDKLSETEVWANLPADCNAGTDNCGNFTNYLQKYFSITRDTQKSKYKMTEYSTFEQNGYFFKLKNGAFLNLYTFYKTAITKDNVVCERIKANGGRTCSIIGNWIRIDVNGFKGPNENGRDIFIFDISDTGYLVPFGSLDYSVYNGNGTYMGSNSWNGYGAANCMDGAYNNRNCAGQIIEEGWVMNY